MIRTPLTPKCSVRRKRQLTENVPTNNEMKDIVRSRFMTYKPCQP